MRIFYDLMIYFLYYEIMEEIHFFVAISDSVIQSQHMFLFFPISLKRENKLSLNKNLLFDSS